MLEQHLHQLTQELELPVLAERQGLHAPLTVDIGSFTVTISPLNSGTLLSIPILPLAQIAQEKREEALSLLMRANFLGQGTGRGSLGLRGDESLLTLSLVLPYEVNYMTFKESIEELVNFADYWKTTLKDFQ
jgi:hypothetical protein